MNWGKRIIALLMALVFIMPGAAIRTQAALKGGNALEETTAYQRLTAFGIIEEGDDISYAETISRGQFLAYAIRMYGYEITVGDYANPFVDLKENDMYYREIVAAYYIGLISGSDGMVRPDDDITWQEAAKILTGLLGYGAVCEASGGYPAGYLTKAAQLGLFPNHPASADYIMPAELIAVLINTLEAELCQVKTVHAVGEKAEYEFQTVRKQTLLTEVHGIQKGQGMINANQYTSLYSGHGSDAGTVHIDDNLYFTGTTAAADLLGHQIDFYYKTEGDERTLVYAAPSAKDTAVTVAADDIVTSRTTERQFVYYDTAANRTETQRIAANASLILNGGQASLYANLICPQNGFVTLVDNDGDNTADVVLVTSYRIMRVSSVSSFDYTIADALGGKTITLDPADPSYNVLIVRDGKTAAFDSIQKNDIISYAESTGNHLNCKRLEISSKRVQGTVEATDDETITIHGSAYRVAAAIQPEDMMKKAGTFYLDYLGRVVDYDGGEEAVYGYLNLLGRTSGIGGTLQAQIFTENNRWVELNFAKRFLYNGEPVNSSEFPISAEYRQLITYTVNSEGEIKTLNTPCVVESPYYGEQEMTLIKNGTFRLSRTFESAGWRTNNNSFDGLVALQRDARIFAVPMDGSTDKSRFFILSAGDLSANFAYTNIKLYDVDEGGLSKVCVMDEGQMKTLNDRSNLVIVAGFAQTVTSDGEGAIALQVWVGDEKLNLPLADESVLQKAGGLSEGDAIQYSTDNNGRVAVITKRFDVTKGLQQKYVSGGVYAAATFAAGYVRYYGNESVRFDAGSEFLFNTEKIGAVYIYDTQDKRMLKGTKDDLQVGAYCFARITYLQAYDLIIFR